MNDRGGYRDARTEYDKIGIKNTVAVLTEFPGNAVFVENFYKIGNFPVLIAIADQNLGIMFGKQDSG